eukprot:6178333-Pleurochrysis_carterae.AAC.1
MLARRCGGAAAARRRARRLGWQCWRRKEETTATERASEREGKRESTRERERHQGGREKQGPRGRDVDKGIEAS